MSTTKSDLTTDIVQYMTRLAHIDSKQINMEEHTRHMAKILDYINMLNEVDTSRIKPKNNLEGARKCVLREDKLEKSNNSRQIIASFSHVEGQFLKTLKIIEN